MSAIFNPVQYVQYSTWNRKRAFGHFQKINKFPQLNVQRIALPHKKKYFFPFAKWLQNTSLTSHQTKCTQFSLCTLLALLQVLQSVSNLNPVNCSSPLGKVTLLPQMSLPWITDGYSQLLFVLKAENISIVGSMWSSSNIVSNMSYI